jgi:putative aldouronate transport system permease protein
MKKSLGEHAFDLTNCLFMLCVLFVTLYPFYYILCASFSSSGKLLTRMGLLFAPLDWTIGGYRMTLRYPLVLSGYRNTLFILAAALPINMLLTLFLANTLAARDMLFKRWIVPFVMVNMFFSGGLIPSFLNIRALGLYNSLWALVLPGSVSIYNSIIVKTAMEGIPESLSDAAYIDGANDFYLLFRIIVPLILPTLAVIVLYYGVAHWNAWFSATIYLTDNSKLPIQAVLRAILIANTAKLETTDVAMDDKMNDFAETIKYTLIVVGTLPILLSYPFLQRYFIKGAMIGAVKG